MEKSTKILLTLTAVALLTTIIVIRKKKKGEEKSNVHGHPGYRPRVGMRNIYGGSYVFPYTPLYGYDQCTYKDKNGLVVVAPCAESMGWSRKSW